MKMAVRDCGWVGTVEAHLASTSLFSSSNRVASGGRFAVPERQRTEAIRVSGCRSRLEWLRHLRFEGAAGLDSRASFGSLFELKTRGATCQATKWADRLSRDLYGTGPHEAPGEKSETATLSWQRVDDGSGRRGSVGSSAVASAFLAVTPKTERTVALPLDYYQILGAETHFLADAVVRVYEARANNLPEEGFSQDALIARREILRVACDTLADPNLRGDYNQALVEDEAGTLMIDVPWSKVPGALCLLQEVGEMEVVLQVGQDLLQERLGTTYRWDMALAMALAYVELSREAMAESPPAIVRSRQMLETALKLLQEEGGSSLAPALQEQVDKTLKQINPRCVLELLALPLDEDHKVQREEGLQGLRSILWAFSDSSGFASVPGFTRDEFMRLAFTHMTAAEQVALFAATPKNLPAESSEVYAAALAHVTVGFVAKKPHLIQEAGELFLQLQQVTTMALPKDLHTIDQERDVSLERGMCALLLGELDECSAWLGLADESFSYRDQSIVEFVSSNSGDSEEDDHLPGLCKLLECWLAEVVFPTFRDTKGLLLNLGDYYDDPGVLSYLERLEKGGSPLAAAAAIVQLGAGAGAAFDTVKTSALETLQKVFPLGKVRMSSRVKDKTGPDPVAKLETSQDLLHRDNAYYSQHNTAVPNSTGESLDFVSPSSMNVTNIPKDGWVYSESRGSRKASQPGLIAVQILCAGAVFGSLALGGWRAFAHQAFQQFLRGATQSVTEVTAADSAIESVEDKVPKMDARLAEQLVRKWQYAKSQALGENHAIGQLMEVLEGQMLKSWGDRAKEVAKNGWHWEYQLLDLSIDSVTISTDGRKATVEATLQEAAQLYDSNHPKITDAYNSTYTTRYELTYIADNWKITSGAVLRS